MNLPSRLEKTKPNKREQIAYKDAKYWVNFMPEKAMIDAKLLGFASKGEVFISDALKGSAMRFVVGHEIYHLNDKQTWLGYFGQELRANFWVSMRHPIGFMRVALQSIKTGRVNIYTRRLAGGS